MPSHRSTALRRICLLIPLAFQPLAALAAEGEITDAERQHWAFQPIVRPDVPPPADGPARTPVDAFLLDSLSPRGLGYSSPADRRTLLRRLKLDLLGLPPTPAEVEAFVSDESPDAYERLVARYLASPHYGERWGRHWLDLVRYADTDGYNADGDRPLAHRYRDYVVRAFNANVGFDRFLAEQLAGDELFPDSEDALVATGYLRLWPDEHNASDVHKARQDALNDITGNVGSVFLGLTLACAQCHDHKFDPILQSDFYELQAYFSGIIPENDAVLGTTDELASYRESLARWEEQVEPMRRELFELTSAARRKAGREKRLKFPAEILEAIDTRPAERTTLQRQFAWWAERQVDGEIKPEALEKQYTDAERARRDELTARLAELEQSRPQPPRATAAMAILDSPQGPAESYLLLGGSYESAFDEVRPQGLAVLEPVSTAPDTVPVPRPGSSGRRAALAAWITDTANPLPARVLANRLWQGHFGKGLVRDANDFGVATPPPTHPALLDWLAAELIDSGWDLKHIHRLIVTSAAYRQAGAVTDADPRAMGSDPENSLLWHYPRRRLDAEAIRDSLLFTSHRLVEEMYGPGVRPELPPGFTTGQSWKVTESTQQRNRRSVYVYAKRNLPHPFLAAFDLPDMFESCGCRVATTTAPQALALLNDAQVLEAANRIAANIAAKSDTLDPARAVHRAFESILGRPPSSDETIAALAFLGEVDSQHGLTDLCHALLNANEFLYLE